MISFIIIGRNEGWKLQKCFESVFNLIKFNQLKDYEIIYVDSNSTDGSIERVLKFNKIKIFKITGQYNAAIARNIGAKESKGNILFFIDGDMEIQANFLSLIYNKTDELKYNFVSGQFIDYNYNHDGKFIYKKPRFKIIGDEKIETTTGGLFLIKKILWDEIRGMRTKYRKSQDFDLGLRLAKKGIKLYRRKEIVAIHHTINYKDKNRIWQMIFKGNEFYLRSVLYRDHLMNGNKFILNIIFRNDYTLILFIFSLVVYLLTNNLFAFIPYIILVLIRSINSYITGSGLSKLIPLYFIIRDIFTIFGFILFYPKSKSIKYISL